MATEHAREIRTVAVIGSGVIGASWASLFLSRGLKVLIADPAPSARTNLEQCLRDTWPVLQRLGDVERASSNTYEFVEDITARLSEADFVQENGPERVDLKQELVQTLDRHARPGVVIATSSSGLPSSAYVQQCQDAGRILVGHPFNPPHLIPLVEVVPHPGTRNGSIRTAVDFYRSLGKRPIVLRHEVPGFVSNRLQAALNNEAYSLLARGVVSAEDLDAAVTSGVGLRWALTGPIVTNAFGGGGGPDGFDQRLERLGAEIRHWEDDILKQRFDWSPESQLALQEQTSRWLSTIDWPALREDRDKLLLDILAIRSKVPSGCGIVQ